MNTKWLCGWLIGTLALVGTAMGATYTDAATNYPVVDDVQSWIDGSNGGTGFGPWAIVADGGEGGWAGCGVWDSAGAELNMGEAFGYVGKVGYVNIDRDFAQALNVGDVFALDFGVNWDSDGGNKGFSLFANGVEVINVNHGGFPGEITLNGDLALAEYGTQTMRWTFTQEAANQISVYATGRDGTETFATTVTTASAYGYLGHVRFYSSGLASNAPDQRQSYFDNLTLEQEGTPPPEPLSLSFTSGTFDPQVLGNYEFVLAREGAVGDDIVLSSSNTNAVTVPASATFAAGSNTLSFMATVVSLTSGPATIVASNAATGVWAEYNVTPVAPTLSIGGPWSVPTLDAVTYTLTRSASVGSTIVLQSSNTDVMTVPASLVFTEGILESNFTGTAVGYGMTTLTASNAATGAFATFDVTVQEPAITLNGPSTAWVGETNIYTVTRVGAIGDTVNLSSTDTNVVRVPATVEFPFEQNTVTFQAVALATGSATLGAANDDDPTGDTQSVAVAEEPGVLAEDDAGNYTPATFINGANLGTGFGVWDLWNTAATLGDSTAGGGGDLNSTNGYSFRFMSGGTGETDWCNARRNFDGALQVGDVLTFTFTYNWCGGQRGVDISSGNQEQFANLIDVSQNDTFKVNGTVVSTNYSPGAVVSVKITQQADGIEVYLTRSVDGTINLAYTTNIVHANPATGVAMYCGGYSSSETDNPNYAMYMNDLMIRGEAPTSLEFTGGTWDPAAVGDYEFELTRSGDVTDNVVLSSDNEAAVTVPAGVMFGESATTVTFTATVVSVTSGAAKIVASNEDTGAWAEYNVYPVAPSLGIDGPWQVYGLGEVQYTLTRTGAVGDEIALGSSATNVATVPATATFGEGETAITFIATGVGYGFTSLTATDAVSGASADFGVTFEVNPNQPIGEITFDPITGDISFAIPAGYGVGTVWGADCQLVGDGWNWQELTGLPPHPDYTIEDGVVTIRSIAAQRRIIRIGWLPE